MQEAGCIFPQTMIIDTDEIVVGVDPRGSASRRGGWTPERQAKKTIW